MKYLKRLKDSILGQVVWITAKGFVIVTGLFICAATLLYGLKIMFL
jgi:hypothetical protein